jgi:hypothetical protein
MRKLLQQRVMRCLCLLSAPLFCIATNALAQSCPSAGGQDAAQPSTLHGTIILHPGTRTWLGLRLDHPVCGTREIELAFSKDWEQAKRMQNCSVTAKGVISESPTVYYSTDLNLFDAAITADPGCRLLRADPDPGKVKIPDFISTYRATVFIDVPGNKPLRGEVTNTLGKGQPLTPWRAYVLVFLNGERDLNLSCRDGFKLVSARSFPRGKSTLLGGSAVLYSSELGPASLTIQCSR